jgi:hypothetical protein
VVVCLRRRSGLEDPAPEDDFDVFVEEKRIGRTWFEPSSTTLQWHWSLSADLGVGTEGRVDSRSKAVEEISRHFEHKYHERSSCPTMRGRHVP